MKLYQGKCCKCESEITKNGKKTAKYNEILLELSNGSVMRVGICPDCFLEAEDFDELASELKKNGTKVRKINKVLKRDNLAQVLKQLQDEKCPVCRKLIEDKWVVTNGEMRHEGC